MVTATRAAKERRGPRIRWIMFTTSHAATGFMNPFGGDHRIAINSFTICMKGVSVVSDI